MAENGQELFIQYIIRALAHSEDRTSELELLVEKLTIAAASAGVQMSAIEQEVGRLHAEIRAAIDRESKIRKSS